ncbi:MAG: lipid-A-disaccharide synthase [Ignavibacteria bacterium]|jgi:lipid-A-disaccharide synthase|nr:lipid-A-disaccharide synthase [Ignavibacteria bacterium]
MQPHNIFIIAGEPSGDMHAAMLIRKLKEIAPNLRFFGIGGSKMRAEGFQSLVPIEEIAVTGFVEVAKRLLYFMKLKQRCEEVMLRENIDCFIPVDYPGFNIKIAKFATSHNIPVYYYIAPQVWAWGKNRWKKLLHCVTKLLVLFPFEEKYFLDKGIDAKFVGHPLLDNPVFAMENIVSNEMNREKELISFYPGSRQNEVERNLQLFTQTALLLAKHNAEYHFGFAVSPNVSESNFDFLQDIGINYTLYRNSYELMQKSHFGVSKAGTTTLEAALLNMNMLMAHKTSPTHYLMGKWLANLDYISLPNILVNKPIVPEYIQKDATPPQIAASVIDFMDNPEKCIAQKKRFAEMRQILGNTGSAENAAKEILR